MSIYIIYSGESMGPVHFPPRNAERLKTVWCYVLCYVNRIIKRTHEFQITCNLP